MQARSDRSSIKYKISQHTCSYVSLDQFVNGFKESCSRDGAKYISFRVVGLYQSNDMQPVAFSHLGCNRGRKRIGNVQGQIVSCIKSDKQTLGIFIVF